MYDDWIPRPGAGWGEFGGSEPLKEYPMDVTRDEDYVDFGLSFQAIVVQHLNAVLKEKEIEEQGARREICEAFLSGLGDFFDKYWIEYEGRRVFPLLGFSENHMDAGTSVDDLGRVLLASEGFAHHEYVFGTVADFYEDDEESLPDILVGNVEDDDDMDDGEEDDMG